MSALPAENATRLSRVMAYASRKSKVGLERLRVRVRCSTLRPQASANRMRSWPGVYTVRKRECQASGVGCVFRRYGSVEGEEFERGRGEGEEGFLAVHVGGGDSC